MVKIRNGLEDMLEENSPYYVYVLECERPRHVYVGYTNDLPRRMREHESGRGSEFTKRHGIKRIIHLDPQYSKEGAMHKENILTLYCMLQTKSFDRVGGGKYAQVQKPDWARREIINVIKQYLKIQENKGAGDGI